MGSCGGLLGYAIQWPTVRQAIAAFEATMAEIDPPAATLLSIKNLAKKSLNISVYYVNIQ